MNSINPYTQKVIKTYACHSQEDVAQIAKASNKAFDVWKQKSIDERADCFYKLADLLRREVDDLAFLISSEMGKTIKEAKGEIDKCAWVCQYYASNTEGFLRKEIVKTEASQSYVTFQPLGTILAIMPWNFPFWQVFRFAASALMAGNTAILKHASNVPGCALMIEMLFKTAEFPQNVFRTVLVSGAETDFVIRLPEVKAVTLTGSTEAGKSVAMVAGGELKKCVLELGGNDPYIIMEDANLRKAAQLCAQSRLLNAGQSCIAAKRFIVDESIYDDFKAEFVKQMEDVNYGDPTDENTGMGPMARIDLRDELHLQVTKSVEMGATVVCGGFIPDHAASFYPPTLLENITPDMPAWNEELFGPVALFFKYRKVEEAIEIANDTSFGLGAGVFSSNTSYAQKLAEENLDAGCCCVNDFVKSDPRLPFGGIKESGYGRELSLYGTREFVNIKTIVVK